MISNQQYDIMEDEIQIQDQKFQENINIENSYGFTNKLYFYSKMFVFDFLPVSALFYFCFLNTNYSKIPYLYIAIYYVRVHTLYSKKNSQLSKKVTKNILQDLQILKTYKLKIYKYLIIMITIQLLIKIILFALISFKKIQFQTYFYQLDYYISDQTKINNLACFEILYTFFLPLTMLIYFSICIKYRNNKKIQLISDRIKENTKLSLLNFTLILSLTFMFIINHSIIGMIQFSTMLIFLVVKQKQRINKKFLFFAKLANYIQLLGLLLDFFFQIDDIYNRIDQNWLKTFGIMCVQYDDPYSLEVIIFIQIVFIRLYQFSNCICYYMLYYYCISLEIIITQNTKIFLIPQSSDMNLNRDSYSSKIFTIDLYLNLQSSSQEKAFSRRHSYEYYQNLVVSVYDNFYKLWLKLTQTNFMLFLNLYTITIVQRYNNVLSYVFIFCIFLRFEKFSNVNNRTFSYKIQFIFSIIMLYIFQFANIHGNVYVNLDPENVKFCIQKYDQFFIEQIIIIVFIIMQHIFLSNYENFKLNQIRKVYEEKSKDTNEQVYSIMRIIQIQFSNKSFILNLFIFYTISLYTVNIIHFFYAVMLLIFIHKYNNLNQIYEIDNNFKQNMEKQQDNFKSIQSLWKVARHYTEFIIILKYVWAMFFYQYHNQYIQLFGVNYRYQFIIKFGFESNGKIFMLDFGSCSILWLLYIFILLQCRAQKFIEDQGQQKVIFLNQNLVHMIKRNQFIAPRFPLFIKLLQKIINFFYLILQWIALFVVNYAVFATTANLINFSYLIFITILEWQLVKQFSRKIVPNKQKNFKHLYILTKFISMYNLIFIILVYFYQFFFAYEIFDSIKQMRIIVILKENKDLIGLQIFDLQNNYKQFQEFLIKYLIIFICVSFLNQYFKYQYDVQLQKINNKKHLVLLSRRQRISNNIFEKFEQKSKDDQIQDIQIDQKLQYYREQTQEDYNKKIDNIMEFSKKIFIYITEKYFVILSIIIIWFQDINEPSIINFVLIIICVNRIFHQIKDFNKRLDQKSLQVRLVNSKYIILELDLIKQKLLMPSLFDDQTQSLEDIVNDEYLIDYETVKCINNTYNYQNQIKVLHRINKILLVSLMISYSCRIINYEQFDKNSLTIQSIKLLFYLLGFFREIKSHQGFDGKDIMYYIILVMNTIQMVIISQTLLQKNFNQNEQNIQDIVDNQELNEDQMKKSFSSDDNYLGTYNKYKKIKNFFINKHIFLQIESYIFIDDNLKIFYSFAIIYLAILRKDVISIIITFIVLNNKHTLSKNRIQINFRQLLKTLFVFFVFDNLMLLIIQFKFIKTKFPQDIQLICEQQVIPFLLKLNNFFYIDVIDKYIIVFQYFQLANITLLLFMGIFIHMIHLAIFEIINKRILKIIQVQVEQGDINQKLKIDYNKWIEGESSILNEFLEFVKDNYLLSINLIILLVSGSYMYFQNFLTMIISLYFFYQIKFKMNCQNFEKIIKSILKIHNIIYIFGFLLIFTLEFLNILQDKYYSDLKLVNYFIDQPIIYTVVIMYLIKNEKYAYHFYNQFQNHDKIIKDSQIKGLLSRILQINRRHNYNINKIIDKLQQRITIKYHVKSVSKKTKEQNIYFRWFQNHVQSEDDLIDTHQQNIINQRTLIQRISMKDNLIDLEKMDLSQSKNLQTSQKIDKIQEENSQTSEDCNPESFLTEESCSDNDKDIQMQPDQPILDQQQDENQEQQSSQSIKEQSKLQKLTQKLKNSTKNFLLKFVKMEELQSSSFQLNQILKNNVHLFLYNKPQIDIKSIMFGDNNHIETIIHQINEFDANFFSQLKQSCQFFDEKDKDSQEIESLLKQSQNLTPDEINFLWVTQQILKIYQQSKLTNDIPSQKQDTDDKAYDDFKNLRFFDIKPIHGVTIENIDPESQIIEPTIFNLSNSKQLVFYFFVKRFKNLFFMLLLIYFLVEQGYVQIMIPLFIIGYSLIESMGPYRSQVIFLYFYLSFIILAKSITYYIFFFAYFEKESFLSYCNNIIGNIFSSEFEIILICFLAITQIIQLIFGLSDQSQDEYQNIFQAYQKNRLKSIFKQEMNKFQCVEKSRQIQDFQWSKYKNLQIFLKKFQPQQSQINLSSSLSQIEVLKVENEVNDQEQRIFFRFVLSKNENFSGFSHRNFSQFVNFQSKAFKQGVDFYEYSVVLLFIICIYIMLFFDQIRHNSDADISDKFQKSYYSGEMVIYVLINIVFILLDRVIYKIKLDRLNLLDQIKRKKDQIYITQCNIRYVLLLFQIILITIYLFIFLPQICEIEQIQDFENISYFYSIYKINNYTLNLYLLYFMYFIVIGVQVKRGYKPIKLKLNISEKQQQIYSFTIISQIKFNILYMIPFLFEIKNLMDWTITKTSMILFDWLTLEILYQKFYISKCQSIMIKNKPKAQPIILILKFFQGFCLLLILLILIFGPMLFFSSYSSFQKTNKVDGIKAEMFMNLNQTVYSIFQNDQLEKISCVDQQIFDKEFKNEQSQDFGKNNCQQFNNVQMKSVSQNSWGISKSNLENISNQLKNNNLDPEFKMYFQLSFQFTREKSQVKSQIQDQNQIQTNIYKQEIIKQTQIQSLYDMINFCNHTEPIKLTNFYNDAARLEQDNSLRRISQKTWQKKDVYLNLRCEANSKNTRNSYWEINQDPQSTEGLNFYIFTEYQQPDLLGYSFFTFYISVVLVVGKVLRLAIEGSQDLHLTKQPEPDQLLQICDAIRIARYEQDLDKEEDLYYHLIDIVRSPEVVQALTGSYVKYIKQKPHYNN